MTGEFCAGIAGNAEKQAEAERLRLEAVGARGLARAVHAATLPTLMPALESLLRHNPLAVKVAAAAAATTVGFRRLSP